MTPRASSHLADARQEWWALAAILLLAAALRLGYPGISEFKMDEAHIAERALDLAQGRAFPLQGIATSVGLPKPPLSIFLYAIPFALTANPLGATLFTGWLNVLAVALCWWLARRYWGRAAGLSAALLFAASPWAVMYSRKIWEPDLVSPFVLACVASGLLGFLEGRPWAQALHILCFGLTLQIHYHTLLIVWLAPLLILLFFRRVHWRAVLLGGALALLPGLPFIYYVARNWAGIAANLGHFAGGAATWSADSLEICWLLASGQAVHSFAGPSAYLDFLRLLPGLSILQWAVGALCLLGLALAAAQAIRCLWDAACHAERRLRSISSSIGTRFFASLRMTSGTQEGALASAAGGIIVLWAILPPLLTLRQSTPLYTHYFTSLLPAPFIAAGILVAALWHSRAGWARYLGAGLVTLLGLGQALVVVTLLAFLGARATPDGFGVPLRALLQARDRALALGAPVVVVGAGDDGQTADWVSAFDVLLRDVPRRYVDGRAAMLWPAAPATIILAPETAAAANAPAESALPARQGEEPFRVWRSAQPFDLQAAGFTEIPGPRALDNGAELLGYQWDGELAPGKQIAWQVAWRVWKSPSRPQTRYQFFSHLLDAQGRQLAQLDAPAPRTADWAVGDLVIQSGRLQAPAGAAGPFSMRLGMYSYPALAAVPVLDVAARPFADALIVGPLAGRGE